VANADKGADFLEQRAKGNGSAPPPGEPLWPEALDLEVLAEHKPEAPKFIVQDWLPCGYATLFAGHGGVGKSGIALHLAVCIAAGVPFFGMETQRRRVLYLSCEDRGNILHWRLERITAYLGISLASLRGWLMVIDLVGCETILWERGRDGVTLTASWEELQARMRAYETEVLFVDGISDTYGGDENKKSEVKRYVNSLVRLIDPERGAAVLIGHIAKPTAANPTTSEGYSGTTGWHNSVRARWYLYPETQSAEDGTKPEKTGELLLELQKSNHGRTDQSVKFTWDAERHLFVGESASLSKFDREHRSRTEQSAILRAFKACTDAATDVPAASTGSRTAFHVLCARKEFPETMRSGRAATRRFWREIENLRALRLLQEDQIRRKDRHYVRVLTLTKEGMRACAL
jgi:RecA-family ATPase